MIHQPTDFLNFIELFYTLNNNKIFDDFNREIKNQIKIIFIQDRINEFYTMNKIKSLDELFQRIKIYILTIINIKK